MDERRRISAPGCAWACAAWACARTPGNMRLKRANVRVRALCAGYDEVPSSVMPVVACRKTTADCTDTRESIRQSDRCVVSAPAAVGMVVDAEAAEADAGDSFGDSFGEHHNQKESSDAVPGNSCLCS